MSSLHCQKNQNGCHFLVFEAMDLKIGMQTPNVPKIQGIQSKIPNNYLKMSFYSINSFPHIVLPPVFLDIFQIQRVLQYISCRNPKISRRSRIIIFQNVRILRKFCHPSKVIRIIIAGEINKYFCSIHYGTPCISP